MICSEIMTKDPECCVPSDSVMKAAQLMKSEDVGPIPIVEDKEEKKLTGIVTDRDLAIKVVAEARDPKTTQVEEVMSEGRNVEVEAGRVERVAAALVSGFTQKVFQKPLASGERS